MAWSRGAGELTQVAVGATTIVAGLMEGWNTESTPDTFPTAAGFDAERGSMLKKWTFNCLDYSGVAAMATLMTNRTLTDVTATYAGGQTQALNDAIIRVTPIVGTVTDSCRVYADTPPANYNSLASGFVDLGPMLGSPTFTFDYPFDGVDGCGRPYFSSGRVTCEFILVGDGTVTNPYTAITGGSLRGALTDVAFQMPNGNFLVLQDVYMYIHYANEDAMQPRAVRVRVVGTGATWASKIAYTNGAASALTDTWGTLTNSVDPGDFFAGAAVEAVGFHYDEPTLVTW